MKKKVRLATIGLVSNAVKDQETKIKQDAEDIKTKYPEIAKMTVAEIVATDLFAEKLKSVIANYNRRLDYYAFKSLEKNNVFEIENFRKEYIACMDKESNMPYAKRYIVLDIGNTAYRRTVTQMMRDYDKAERIHLDEIN